ncbi:ATP-binding protein [Microseira sp. BLCC-F43]|jgi:signal transduction histidine kinase|uniref:sensor histidine kinase n=1 Tax=Microseira sp. BLCC-F43 TaxID=3153602 RepID=UPI0035B7E386
MKVFRKRHVSVSDLRDRGTPIPQNQRWRDLWGEARTRILVWYVVILTLTFGMAIPAFRQLLFARVDARVRQDMLGEVEDFRELLAGRVNLERLENNRIDDNDTAAIREVQPISSVEQALMRDLRVPTTEQEMKRFFEAYLKVEIPEDNIFLITFVNGTFYESSPKALPKDLKPDTDLMRQWATQAEPGEGKQVSQNRDINRIFYFVEPIKTNGKILGTLVIAHSAEEHAEILEAVVAIAQVVLAVLLIALLLVWFAAGRILQPLRELAITAQSISGSDLTQRIPVRGKGELANLAVTFNKMMDRLESSFISQRNFVNDAGHELRTPITIIRGYLELMASNPDDWQENLAIVVDELGRISSFVDDLILLAQAESPNFLQLEIVDTAAITQEIFDRAQTLASRNWQLEAAAKGKIIVDRQRIIQAIMHLVRNATQHTETTDAILIGSKICKGKVHFWVQDRGEGIDIENQQRIFDRFARVPNRRRSSEGAGLGLSIVKAITEAHKGQVTLYSQVGVGSTFTIVLPLEAV